MFDNPYFVAALTAVLTAALTYLYARTLEDPKTANKTFFKVLVAGLVAGGLTTWLAAYYGGGDTAGSGTMMDRPPTQPFMQAL